MIIQLTNPIISFEIMFVFAMFVWTIIGFLRPDYDRDVQRFIREAIARSNVLLVLALFLLAIVIGLLGHLYHLMKPYNVQLEHEQWIDKMLLKLECMFPLYCIPSILYLVCSMLNGLLFCIGNSRSHSLLRGRNYTTKQD